MWSARHRRRARLKSPAAGRRAVNVEEEGGGENRDGGLYIPSQPTTLPGSPLSLSKSAITPPVLPTRRDKNLASDTNVIDDSALDRSGHAKGFPKAHQV